MHYIGILHAEGMVEVDKVRRTWRGPRDPLHSTSSAAKFGIQIAHRRLQDATL